MLDWQRRGCKLLPQAWAEHIGYPTVWETESPENVECATTELPEHSVAFHITIQGHEQPTLLAIPSELGLALVQSVLGQSVESLEEARALTSIETSLLEVLAGQVASALNEGAQGAGFPTLVLAQYDPRPLMIGLFPTEAELVVLRFTVSGPFGKSELRWLWPESLAETLFNSNSHDNGDANATESPQLRDLLLRAPFEITVELGTTELNVSELAELKVGDVLVFDQKISEPLNCIVGEQVIMRAWPATTGKQQSIQIEGNR
jgi:flagellar motor switch protein FliM